MAEFIGVLAVVISLLFVAYELRLARLIADSEAGTQSLELTINLGDYISNNADIWSRGCMAEELTTSEAVIFGYLVTSVIDYQFTRWMRFNTGFVGAPRALSAYRVAYNRYNFPGFNAVWETKNYGPNFTEAIDEQYELLVQSNSERTYDAELCGRNF